MTVTLLSEYPENANPDGWMKITWPRYEEIFADIDMVLVPGQGGIIQRTVIFEASGESQIVKCFAITKNNALLFFGNLDPTLIHWIRPGENRLFLQAILFAGTIY